MTASRGRIPVGLAVAALFGAILLAAYVWWRSNAGPSWGGW